MQIAKEIAGFSPAEAETLRKAIGKKIHELMASLKDKFLEGAAQTGTTPGVAQQLWKDMESSQDYSFNKAHSACYALIAYRTAWLKANHPHEYMAALISSVMNTKDRVPLYVNACREMGIEVLPPDVNESQCDFAVVEGHIRFGLNAVKNVGDSAARAIIAAREEGGAVRVALGVHRARRPGDRQQARARVARQVRRARLDRRAPEGHARAARGGARVGRPPPRRPAVGPGLDLRYRHRRRGGTGAEAPPGHPARRARQARAARDGEGELGLYVSEHPLQGIAEQLRRKTDCRLTEVERRRDGEVVTVGGLIAGVKQLTTKKGEPMVFLQLEDVTGGAEVVVFNSVYAQCRELLEQDRDRRR